MVETSEPDARSNANTMAETVRPAPVFTVPLLCE
jgi:hypothetical protein